LNFPEKAVAFPERTFSSHKLIRKPGMPNPDKVPKFIKELTVPKSSSSANPLKDRVKPTPSSAPADPHFQLDMFFDLEIDERSWQYSNILALWDQIPKGKAYNGVSSTPSVLVSKIDFEGTPLIIEQLPSQMQRVVDGKEIIEFVFPGKIEEKILDAIRYICTERKEIAYSPLNSGYDFKFITHQIYLHLKSRNETHTHSQIKTALEVLSKSHLTIYNEDKTDSIASTLITNMFMSTSKHIGKVAEEDALIVLQMHALFTYAVKHGDFLPYNYDLTKDLKTSLAVLIYRMMAIEFRNAGTNTSYVVDTKSTMAKSMYGQSPRLSEEKKKMISATNELVKAGLVSKVQPIERFGANGRLISCKFELFPTQLFIKSMIDSNVINKRRTAKNHRKGLKSISKSTD
jgi:hypothetical protein